MNHVSTFTRLHALMLLLLLASAASWAQKTPAIGAWDGVTASALLEGPYEDPAQVNIPFGIISYYHMPWRGYMDTWPASKYLDFGGVNWNIDNKYAEPICQMLHESGFAAIRIEIGWGSLNWDDQLRPDTIANLNLLLSACKKWNIRPLILLNAHHGIPGPMRDFRLRLLADAHKGDRTIKVQDTSAVRIGYSGLPNSADYIGAYNRVTAIDADGTLHLSTPLLTDLKAGPITLQDQKYQPFQGTKLKDGTPVPAARETFDGWVKYAATVGEAVRTGLGTADAPDAGFDVEVWNELTFGSNFLDINNYYNPKLQFAEDFTYEKTRIWQPGFRPDARLHFTVKGYESILPMTIDYFADPQHGFPGVRVISGFSNQSPWANGSELWAGQAGFSRHYYTGGWQDCSPLTPLSPKDNGTIDALNNFDGKRDNRDWQTIVPGSNFVPTLRVAMPEFMLSGFKTEEMVRDLSPDSRWSSTPDWMHAHGRYTNNGDNRPALAWQTEVNYDKSQFIDQLMQQTGKKNDDPSILAMTQHLSGKFLLRQFFMQVHKGMYRETFFCVGPDMTLGLLPASFYTLLDNNKLQLSDAVRQGIPAEFQGFAALAKVMRSADNLTVTRPLRVNALREYQPRLAFAGDGTPAHPNRWNRDNFAFLPFQLSANRYAVGYYVATLDVTHAWNPTKELLDPTRYDMPEQEFDVTIGNVLGTGAKAEAYDPLRNQWAPVKIINTTATSLTVRLKTVDYPRMLYITEAQAGPQILTANVGADAKGQLTVNWKTNMPTQATLSFGHDWQHRNAKTIIISGKASERTITIPTGITDLIAARLTVTANGLTSVWPRWDEDPQGQVTIPGTPIIGDNYARTTASSSLDLLHVPEPATPSRITQSPLPLMETNAARGYSLALPKGVTLNGDADDRSGMLGATHLQIRYLPGAASTPDDYLPVIAVGDHMSKTSVSTRNAIAWRVDYSLAATSHPDMINLTQAYLLLATGKNKTDLLLINLTGTPTAMAAQAMDIQQIFASVELN